MRFRITMLFILLSYACGWMLLGLVMYTLYLSVFQADPVPRMAVGRPPGTRSVAEPNAASRTASTAGCRNPVREGHGAASRRRRSRPPSRGAGLQLCAIRRGTAQRPISVFGLPRSPVTGSTRASFSRRIGILQARHSRERSTQRGSSLGAGLPGRLNRRCERSDWRGRAIPDRWN